MEDTVCNRAIAYAYGRGFRVTEDGRLLNPVGKQLSPGARPSGAYPVFSVFVKGSKKQSIAVPVHKFAAFCFYGEAALEKRTQVRHLSGDLLDFSKNNLQLGTPSENALDIDEKIREARATTASLAALRKSRLSEQDVVQLREIYAEQSKRLGKLPEGERRTLCAAFEISSAQLTAIVTGRTYSSCGGPVQSNWSTGAMGRHSETTREKRAEMVPFDFVCSLALEIEAFPRKDPRRRELKEAVALAYGTSLSHLGRLLKEARDFHETGERRSLYLNRV